ncbi:Sorbitol dehydrogenase, partial [Dysosmobacter welbionis]
QVMDLLMGRDARPLHCHRNQLLGQQIVQRVAEVVVGVLLKVPQQPLVQGLLIQGGLQVNLQPVGLFAEVPHVGGGRQHQGPADTEVGEQHLPEVRVDLLPVLKHRQPHIPQAQALELPAQAVIPQRHQRALKVRHRMPRFPGHSVPLSCGAGGGVTDAAGGKDYRPGRVCPPLSPDTCDGAGGDLQLRRPVPGQRDLQRLQPPLQSGADVKGPVTDGKHPIPPLGLQRHADGRKERHGVPAVEPGKGAVQKLAVPGHVGQQGLYIGVVGDVAPALAGDVQLLSQPLIGLQQRHPCAPLRRGDSGHHPGGSPADHYQPLTHRPSSRTRRRRSRCPPAPQRCGT